MTGTEALIKAIELYPAIVGMNTAGVIGINAYQKEIQMRCCVFRELFSDYNEVPQSNNFKKLFVNVNGYEIFTLTDEEDDDNGVGTGAA